MTEPAQSGLTAGKQEARNPKSEIHPHEAGKNSNEQISNDPNEEKIRTRKMLSVPARN
jgi:hypothetical protein